MRSMQTGYYDYMIDSSVRTYTGHIQIQGKDYWEKRSFEESMILDDELIKKVNQIEGVQLTVKRLETFSLISYEMVTRVVQVVGIDPNEEDKLTSLKSRIIKGEYLTNDSRGIILAEGLADLLNADIGDSILIYGQGLYGITAAELIPVQAIARFSLPAQNKAYAYLSLPYSQWVYSAPDRLTSLSIMLDNRKKINSIQNEIKTLFEKNDENSGEGYDIMTWEELSPELVQYIQVDNAQGIIMLGILYIVIAFGIFGTIMMMTAERLKEFGILISVGMKKWKLYLVTTLETIFISFIGVVAGAIVSLPLLIYFVNNPIPLTGDMAEAIVAWGFDPILPFALYPGMFIAQLWTVLAIALVSGLYPINFIRKIKPVEAMRG